MNIIKIENYLEQKGGTSDARIEDNRQNKIFSFARVHPRTDIVLQIGQKYVFQRFNEPDYSNVQIGDPDTRDIHYLTGLDYHFEELEYLGQKKMRMMQHLGNVGETDKRRPRVEKIVEADRIEPNVSITFVQMHAFKKFTTGQVLMLDDLQVADHICL